jgi:hypothetical protein
MKTRELRFAPDELGSFVVETVPEPSDSTYAQRVLMNLRSRVTRGPGFWMQKGRILVINFHRRHEE